MLIHGFVNCQKFKLTANRGSIANTNPKYLEELRGEVAKIINEVDDFLKTKGLYTLRSMQDEEKTREQERTEFERRKKFILKRPIAKLGERLIVEPATEAEVFGLFVNLYCLHPDLFDFEPVDYNTKLGIDMIAKNKNDTSVIEQDYWYVEFKNLLDPKFNHAFRHVRFIVCWDFGRGVDVGSTEFRGVEEDDVRKMSVARKDGKTSYFLDNPYRRSHKIEVVRLKEFLKERLNIEFAPR